MAISFSCSRCGKKLKAPDNAVGKSSKCPGCGSPVTCPEPVYDAELIEPPLAGPNPYDDLDDGTPYGVSGPAPGEEVDAGGPEPRKPCPMCGEMIVATAAKCRFCGEVFDKKLKKGARKAGKAGRLQSIASCQRGLLLCILLEMVSYIGLIALGQMKGQASPAMGLIALGASLVLLGAAIGGFVFTLLLSSKLYNVAIGILLAILTIVPCLGLLILLMVNQKATSTLQDNGFEVGLLGARA